MSILIAGSGIPGLTLALALRRGLGASVTVCDPAIGRDPFGDLRASAVAAGARWMFQVLRVWDSVAENAQPITAMVITDSRPEEPVRPTYLTFGGDVEPGEPFAHMLENGHLVTALREACVAAGVVVEALGVTRFDVGQDGVSARLDDGRVLASALLVGADGVRSTVRAIAGIDFVGWGYGQSGLVATLRHTREHEGRAFEHFLPSGPFAMLPLTGKRSSIVWTEREEEARRALVQAPDDLIAAIEERFGPVLGRLSLDTPIRAYTVAFGMARRFAGARVALIGDAAHVIHPIAGQGLNLGLRDAAALAEAIADAMRLGLDPGSPDVLARYEQARRFDTLAMGAMTDGLNRLFSRDALPLRVARDFGLGIVERMPALKRRFIREAAGLSGTVPRLMRGEAL